MTARQLGSALLITFLLVSSIVSLLSFLAVPQVKAQDDNLQFSAMYPSDGDSWTEQSPDYWTDVRMDTSWITSDVEYGSYSLNATHTGASSTGYLYLTLPSQTDVSSYEYLYFRMKVIHSSEIPQMAFYLQNRSAWSSSYPYLAWSTSSGYVKNNAWFNVAVATHNGELMQSCPSQTEMLQQFQILWIYMAFGVAQSNATVLVDGFRFCNITLSTTLNYTEQARLNNVIYWIERAERTTTFGGQTYTTLYDTTNITHGTMADNNLQTETLSQIIHGYLLAYEYSSISYFLTKAELYAQLMIAMQDQSGVGYIPDKSSTLYLGTATYAGWQLTAFSHLYDATSNSTYSTVAGNLRHFIVDYLWDDANIWMDDGWNNSTQIVDEASTLNLMETGSCITGLSIYYRHVSQNTSVADVIDKFYNLTILNRPSGWKYKEGSWHLDLSETTSYTAWGYYYSWKSLSNTSYRDMWYDIALRNFEQETIVGLTDRSFPNIAYQNYAGMDGSYPVNNWGASNNIADLTLAYDDYSQVLGIVERGLDLFAKNQSLYGWVFHGSGSGIGKLMFNPTAGYVASAQQFYHSQTVYTDPTLIFSSGNISEITLATEQLTIDVFNSAGETSTLIVDCGNRGEPTDVSGVASSSYDSSNQQLTVTVTHSSEEEVVVDWSASDPSASGLYELNVNVKMDGLPLAGVTVDITGIGGMLTGDIDSKVTDSSGKVSWQLPYGVYAVRATYQDKVKSMTVWLNSDRPVGFDFGKSAGKHFGVEILLVPLFFIIVGLFILPKLMRRRG